MLFGVFSYTDVIVVVHYCILGLPDIGFTTDMETSPLYTIAYFNPPELVSTPIYAYSLLYYCTLINESDSLICFSQLHFFLHKNTELLLIMPVFSHILHHKYFKTDVSDSVITGRHKRVSVFVPE